MFCKKLRPFRAKEVGVRYKDASLVVRPIVHFINELSEVEWVRDG